MLDDLSISNQRYRCIATEGALMGAVLDGGRCDDLVIVSDDAGQFNILLHALYWVHTERLIHKMIPLNDTHGEEIEQIWDQIWSFYVDLKGYKEQPDESLRTTLNRHFDEIFLQKNQLRNLQSNAKNNPCQ